MTRAPEFTGSVRVRNGVALVMLAGEADIYSAPLLAALLQEAVATGAPSVVVDMALVSFCDAAGLGLLVRTGNELAVRDARLSVRAAPVFLRRLLDVTGLTGPLRVEPATTSDGLLAVDLAAAARLPLTRAVLDAALKLVVVMSRSVMRGADGVSITLARDGRLRTVAASNDVVLQMDHDQYDTGEGPCLDAAKQGALFSSTALELEDRWPHFVPRARARGIESIMSTPVMSGDRPLGALNVYSRAPDALASHEQEWASQFAQEASRVLLAAATPATAASVDAEIHQALHSREVIALAQGLIMARHTREPEAAYRLLIDISRRTSRPLLAICQELVDASGAQQDSPTPDPSRGRGGWR